MEHKKIKQKSKKKCYKSTNDKKDIPIDLKEDILKNNEERLYFIKKWASYVRKNKDLSWSEQQNVLINSQIQNSKNIKITREQYLKILGEKFIKKNIILKK